MHRIILILLLAAPLAASSHELPLFGALPKAASNWKLHKEGARRGSPQWSWVVLVHSDSGDLLSFAAHKPEQGENRQLVHLSDTAHELFPGGYCILASLLRERWRRYFVSNVLSTGRTWPAL